MPTRVIQLYQLTDIYPDNIQVHRLTLRLSQYIIYVRGDTINKSDVIENDIIRNLSNLILLIVDLHID